MVKRAAGALIPALPGADDDPRLPRRERVYRRVLQAMRSGALAPGDRLPSARELARDWQCARGAVDEAFAQLQSEGLVERRVGDGSYVSAQARRLQGEERPPVLRPPSQAAQQVLDRFAVYLGKPPKLELPHTLLAPTPLFARAPMTDAFPLATWRRLIARAHGEAFRDHLSYGPAAGLPRTREAIARHLSLTRGTLCTAEQVLVVNSPMQAIELIARVLLEPGDTVWLEDPGHPALAVLFPVLKAKVVGVPLDEQGLDVAAGRAAAPHAAAAYLHPLTQFPLGVRTSQARRAELLRWADDSGAWIIEGNFNDEITHDPLAPAALQAMDRSDRVVLMGTFEGILYPSLRLGYLVVPQRLAPVFIAMRGLFGDHCNTALQLALSWFIDEGHMSEHLRKLRRLARERRDALRESAAKHLPEWARLGPMDGGTHCCLHLPPELSDREVVRRIRERGVIAIALSSVALVPGRGNALVLGYAAFEPALIDRSLRVIGEALRSLRPTAAEGPHQPAGENR